MPFDDIDTSDHKTVDSLPLEDKIVFCTLPSGTKVSFTATQIINHILATQSLELVDTKTLLNAAAIKSLFETYCPTEIQQLNDIASKLIEYMLRHNTLKTPDNKYTIHMKEARILFNSFAPERSSELETLLLAPCINEMSIMLDPIQEIPVEKRFFTAPNQHGQYYVFNIDNLFSHIKEAGFINPYTQRPFSTYEIRKLRTDFPTARLLFRNFVYETLFQNELLLRDLGEDAKKFDAALTTFIHDFLFNSKKPYGTPKEEFEAVIQQYAQQREITEGTRDPDNQTTTTNITLEDVAGAASSFALRAFIKYIEDLSQHNPKAVKRLNHYLLMTNLPSDSHIINRHHLSIENPALHLVYEHFKSHLDSIVDQNRCARIGSLLIYDLLANLFPESAELLCGIFEGDVKSYIEYADPRVWRLWRALHPTSMKQWLIDKYMLAEEVATIESLLDSLHEKIVVKKDKTSGKKLLCHPLTEQPFDEEEQDYLLLDPYISSLFNRTIALTTPGGEEAVSRTIDLQALIEYFDIETTEGLGYVVSPTTPLQPTFSDQHDILHYGGYAPWQIALDQKLKSPENSHLLMLENEEGLASELIDLQFIAEHFQLVENQLHEIRLINPYTSTSTETKLFSPKNQALILSRAETFHPLQEKLAVPEYSSLLMLYNEQFAHQLVNLDFIAHNFQLVTNQHNEVRLVNPYTSTSSEIKLFSPENQARILAKVETFAPLKAALKRFDSTLLQSLKLMTSDIASTSKRVPSWFFSPAKKPLKQKTKNQKDYLRFV